MNRFELKNISIYTIEHLNKSNERGNLFKMGIDIKLPQFYHDDPQLLTKPIEIISTCLSDKIVNGVIAIDLKNWNEHEDKITILVQFNASNASVLAEEFSKEIAAKVSEINTAVGNQVFDFNYNIPTGQIACSYKVNLHAFYKVNKHNDNKPFLHKRILLAEDNEINAMIFSSFLDEWGCLCEVVANGAAAINRLQTTAFDLILMDIYMPVLNGIDTTRAIRGFNTSIPIIALTASTLDSDINDAWAAGIDDLVLKPVSSANLFFVLSKFF